MTAASAASGRGLGHTLPRPPGFQVPPAPRALHAPTSTPTSLATSAPTGTRTSTPTIAPTSALISAPTGAPTSAPIGYCSATAALQPLEPAIAP